MESKKDEFHEQKNFDDTVKHFFSDKKNTAIAILSVLLLLCAVLISYSKNTTVETVADTTRLNGEVENLRSNLKKAQGEIAKLETDNETLLKEKESLAGQVDSAESVEMLQKTIVDKENYILYLEAQVGTLTAEKAHLEGEKGILEQQLQEASSKQSSQTKSTTSETTSSKSSSSSTTNSYTVYVTNTGSKYHRSGCSYLRSQIAMDKNNAISQGYTACSRCNP